MPTLLKTLASYLPSLIVRHHSVDATAPHEPVRVMLYGALLFADISGFTALTEQLAQHGPRGVEELTRLLNTSFGQILDTIETSGGDVIKFAGDALLALWPAAEHDLADVTRRASQCALMIHSRVANFYRLIDSTPLAMRIGIATGELAMLRIGGLQDRWEFLITGDPLAEVGAAESLAQPGVVVLAPSAWALIQHWCGGSVITATQASGDSYMRLDTIHAILDEPMPEALPLNPVMDAALRAYIPSAVLSRIVAGQTAWLAELRRVTVIFANLPMISQHTSLEQAQRVMQSLQAALYRYEGSINKISIDDKGVTLVAALGLPPLSHEDDAARGVQAALAIREALSEQHLHGAIGVTSGRAFCGEIGSLERREYTMIGDVVNLAARLMQAAAEHATTEILCDEATYLAARSRLSFVPLPPMIVKGKLEPVAVYQPQLRSSVGHQVLAHDTNGLHSSERGTQIVGRDTEQALLAAQVQALRAGGPGGLVLIEAEAGMGKSHMVEAIRHLAAHLKLTTFVGAGDATERSTPYYAWRSVFSHLFDLSILSAPEARRAHILSLLEDEDEILPLASLLNAVLPLDLPETEATAQMSGLVRADATRALLLRLLQDSVARSPKLLVLEDAHWFDSASWALALAVSQSIQPLLLIMTMRPSTSDSHHTIVPEYHQLATAAQVRMVLDALAPDHAITLVCQRLGVAALPEPVAALIREKAQGNPFFSEELAFALRDAGLLRIDGDQCQLAPDADLRALSFPETVQGAIISRIDRLAPTQQLTLKVASVIGRVFPVRTLEAVYPINIMLGGLSDDLATLARLDITPLDAIEPELAYSFKHAITQDVVYNLMLFAQRRQLHRAVAEWYERAYADDLAWLYPLLAYHWGKAGVVARALDYFEHAGRHALSMSAVREAQALAEQGLALLGSTGPESMEREPLRQMHLTSLLGEAHQQLGEFMAARTALERSLVLARSLGDHNGISDALSLLGRVATDIGAYAEARGCLEEGRELAFAAGERMRVAQALSNLGNVGMRQGTYAESERNYQDALAIFTSLGHRPGVALVLNGLGNNAVDRGEYDVATYCYEESLAIRRALGDRWGISSSLSNLGWVAHLQHDYAAARAYYEESLLIARAIGDQRGKAIVLNNLGFTDYALGDDRAAAACFDEALAVATTIGAIPLVLELLVGIARLLARAGQPAAAAELLGLALAHPAVNTDVRTQAELFLGELGDSLAAADLAQALERGKGRDLTETVAELIESGRGV